jgi:hypothetical protein
MPVGVVVMHDHIEFERRQLMTLCVLDRQIIGVTRQGKLEQLRSYVFQRHPQINEGPNAHIARYASVAVKIYYSHVDVPVYVLEMKIKRATAYNCDPYYLLAR